MMAIKHRIFSALFVCSSAFVFVSCKTYYQAVSLVHEPLISFKERPVRQPELLFLGNYDVRVFLYKNDEENECYASIDICNGKRNQKLYNLQVTLRDLKQTDRKYELKNINLVQAKYREINPPQKKSNLPTSSPIHLDLDSNDSYDLMYTFKSKPERKSSQKVCVKVEANYEDNGELKFFRDSVAFQKETGFTFH